MSIAIVDYEIISALGNNKDEFKHALFADECAIKPAHRYNDICTSPLAEFKDINKYINKYIKDDKLINSLINIVMDKILIRNNILSQYNKSEIGLFLGTSTAGIEKSLGGLAKFQNVDNNFINCFTRNDIHSSLLQNLRQNFALHGMGLTFTTACSSSALAIKEAMWALNNDLIKIAIVGGIDILSPLTIYGFSALQLLATTATLPFSLPATGMSLGEACALIILQKENTLNTRHKPHLIGAGASSDAYNMTTPEPNGSGMIKAMQNALIMAKLAANDIGYINAHGTGTGANDTVESLAINKIFGDRCYVSSTKSRHGHCLGTSGVVELIVSMISLEEQIVWKNFNNSGKISNINLAKENTYLQNMKFVLSNSFGFGGNNVSLILAKGLK